MSVYYTLNNKKKKKEEDISVKDILKVCYINIYNKEVFKEFTNKEKEIFEFIKCHPFQTIQIEKKRRRKEHITQHYNIIHIPAVRDFYPVLQEINNILMQYKFKFK